MNSVPILSVILCTYNNADSLAVTLSQIAQCHVANPETIEVLVVDNNSGDHTSGVVETAQSVSSVSIKYCFEPKQGLSSARNHGVDVARGSYLLFTDDDADIPSNWLSSYLEKVQLTNADCLFSRIEILWDRPPPWWFDERFNPYFVHLDYGERQFQVDDFCHEFFGKNFCCKKSVLGAMGGFDEKLGRKGGSLAAGEETIIYKRLIDQGARVVYFPDAPVGHRLKPDEYTPANIEKKFVDGATSSLLIANAFATKRLFGRPIYPLKEAVQKICSSMLALPTKIGRSDEYARRDVFFHWLQVKRAVRMIGLWISSP